MQEIDTKVLFRPDSDALKFLPEGPYSYLPNQFSWVAIQHGADSKCGSLNVFDLGTRQNQSFDLKGRPGFAFPTDQADTFVVGLERRVDLVNIATGETATVCDGVDADVDNTIINDGITFEGGLIFGAKEMTFTKAIAGLYLWRTADRQLIPLRTDQICSNGKALIERNGRCELIDIDSPTKTVVSYLFDLEAGTLGDKRIVLDLTSEDIFPDGMILTPDGNGMIIAFYDPHDSEFGVARQYGIESGEVEAVWKTPASPQVTCPQLVNADGAVKLILTTAAEHMSAERQARHSNAGCLFIGETDFSSLPDQPVYRTTAS